MDHITYTWERTCVSLHTIQQAQSNDNNICFNTSADQIINKIFPIGHSLSTNIVDRLAKKINKQT